VTAGLFPGLSGLCQAGPSSQSMIRHRSMWACSRAPMPAQALPGSPTCSACSPDPWG
jgi:hypothetical protein